MKFYKNVRYRTDKQNEKRGRGKGTNQSCTPMVLPLFHLPCAFSANLCAPPAFFAYAQQVSQRFKKPWQSPGARVRGLWLLVEKPGGSQWSDEQEEAVNRRENDRKRDWERVQLNRQERGNDFEVIFHYLFYYFKWRFGGWKMEFWKKFLVSGISSSPPS